MEALCAPFLWSLVPVIWQGFRYDKLVASELPALPKKFAAENVLPRALEIWPKLSSTSCWCRCIPKSLRLLCFLWLDEFSLGMFWSCVQGVLPTVVRPLLLKNLIDHVGSDDDWDKSTAVVYVVALLATLILEGFSTTAARVYLADRCGAALVSTWSGMIYSKALRVASGASDNERTLLSNDVMKCFDQAKILCMFPQCFSAVLGGVCMLLLTIGSSAIIGLVLLFLTLCITSYMSRLCASAEQKALSGADARLRLMTKAVEGIKAVKLSAWEPQFLAQISDARRVEVRWVTRRRFFYQCGVQIGRCAPVFCAAASIMAIVLFDGDFIPGNVFAAVSIFQSMRLAMTMIPTGLSILASWSVSAKRLDKFFELSEMAGLSSQLDKGVLLQASGAFIQQGKDYHSSFRCEVGHLNILTGRVTAIVGAVGSGKTTLLLGLLGEVAVEGWCRIASSRVGYIPQQAFVVSGSLRQNVLMGRDYSEIEYNKALFRAALDVDIAAMPYGDATEIGERGVTLSGGQQQRLNIARAIYSCPDLLVADDPLSAVDARVGKHIADHCIFNWRLASGDLGTVIVCLNQLHLLPRCDDTIVLKDGKIVEQGCFGALSESPSSALSSMIKGLGLEAAGADKAADMDAQEQTKESAIVGKTQLTQAESIAEGAIRANVWRSYARGMGYGYCVLCFICPVGAYVCGGVSDRWLAEWLDKKITLSNSEDVTYGCIYGALVVGMAAGLIITTSVFSCSTARAGRSLHDDACSGLFHAPLSWFESTPSGRIISRFASDLSAVDYNFSTFLEHVTGFAGQSFVILAVLCILAPAVAVVLPFALFLFCLKMVAVERSSRALKRFANAAMSPVVSCFAEATHSQGRPLLRAMGLREASWQAFASAVNELVRCNMLASSVISWQTSWSYRISFLFSFVCSVWVLFGPIKTPTAQLGLALTYAFLLPYFLLYFAFCFSILKMNGTSLERLLEACLLPREADWYLGSSPITDSTQWPKKGQIAFEDVVLVYRPGLPPALSGVSLTIPGGSRVGVVGRTGAGKSSLIVPLFRLVDPYSGRVLLDGIDVQGVGLQQLRRCMSIIPQEPLLLTGTIRDNLDPFGDRSDADLVKVLADVGLDLSLDGCVNQGASGLSGGERQLVTMARALLQKAVVCVMDEPTSQVDHKTDAAVQRAVRECLVGRTLVTIAHRLQTVIDFDIIVVMDSGKVVENGSPTELLGKLEGHFARMAAVAGGREALLKQARGEDYHSKSATIVAV